MDKKKYGWLCDLPDQRDLRMYFMPRLDVSEWPLSVDLVNDYMPPVYDQGQTSSCTGNAIAAAVQYDHAKQLLPHNVPSRLFAYYNGRLLEDNQSWDVGAAIRDVVKGLNKYGICDEATWPFDDSAVVSPPSDAAYAEGALHPSVEYRRLDGTEDSLKGCLASGFPFVFGFTVYDAFESDTVAKSGVLGLPAANEATVGGHAVLCVGFDDGIQRFKVRNSWSATWGQSGYFTMPYAYLTDRNLSDDFWVVTIVK